MSMSKDRSGVQVQSRQDAFSSFEHDVKPTESSMYWYLDAMAFTQLLDSRLMHITCSIWQLGGKHEAI